MSVVDGSFDHPLEDEERGSALLAGGIMMHGYQCGMLWGASLAAGARAHQLHGPGPRAEAEAIAASQRLVKTFRARTKGEIDCSEVTHMNWQDANQVVPILKFFVRGGPAYCFWMAAKYAPEAFKDIDTYFTEHQIEAPSAPVSCASILAQKLGMSEMHQTMAAGFAGGIGLSGGGCGALGAAVWKHTMESGEIEMEGFAMNNPGAQAAIDRFVQASDYEFECAEIVGRKFEDVNDHAEYVREGGCAKIIEAIAAQSPAE